LTVAYYQEQAKTTVPQIMRGKPLFLVLMMMIDWRYYANSNRKNVLKKQS